MNEPSPENKTPKNNDSMVRKGSRIVPLLMLGVALLIFLAWGIDSPALNYIHSPMFSTSDFNDLDGLVKQLHSEKDALGYVLWRRFTEDTQDFLTSDLPRRYLQKQRLAKEFNLILRDKSIYGDLQEEMRALKPKSYALVKIPGTPGSEFPTNRMLSHGHRIKSSVYTRNVASGPKPGWQFRVFDKKGDQVDYDEDDFPPGRPGEVESLKKELNAANPQPSGELASKVVSLLVDKGYTGCKNVDSYIEGKASANLSRDNVLWVNRSLFECFYPDGITNKNLIVKGTSVAGDSYVEFDTFGAAKNIWLDTQLFIKSQIETVLGVTLCSLIAGLAGLICRRAFRRWFLAAFVILWLVNWVLAMNGISALGKESIDAMENSYGSYFLVEALLVLLLLAYNLRRHSVAVIDARTKRNNIIVAVFLILLAIGWGYLTVASSPPQHLLLNLPGALTLFLMGYTILLQTLRAAREKPEGCKNIVVCLDGTWNEPGTTDFGKVAETNVLKLFKMLKGESQLGKHDNRRNASRCKQYPDPDGNKPAKQVAFYYHGVGNKLENSELGQMLGGAFGMGASAIVDRAYLDVASVYQPGDRIFIFGFSRGAAIARLLAGAIGRRGIPTIMWTLGLLGRHWTVWASNRKIEDVTPVEVLGCWDTVGAFGISKNILGIPFQQMNLLKDLTVSLCVKRAYHMVALDETRDAFVPTLMEPDPTNPKRIVEVWFSGNHSNVGGGFATDQLSDVTLDFLLRHLSSGYAWDKEMEPGGESWGLYLSATANSSTVNGCKAINPDPLGALRHSTGAVYSYAPRKMPPSAVIHDSVFERMAGASAAYAPQSLFDLNEELFEKRMTIEKHVNRLPESGPLTKSEIGGTLVKLSQKLSMTKWSEYLEWSTSLQNAEDLSNPPAEAAGAHSKGAAA